MSKKRVNVKVRGHNKRMTGIYNSLTKKIKTVKGEFNLSDVELIKESPYNEKS